MRLQVGEFDRQARAFAFLQLVLLSVIMVGQKVFEGDDFGPTKSNLRHGCRQTFRRLRALPEIGSVPLLRS